MGLRVIGVGGAIEYTFRATGPSVEMGMQREPGLTLYQDGRAPLSIPVATESAYENEVAYFVDHARRGAQVTRATPDDGYRALAVAVGARESLESGRPVVLKLS
jgi:predicted dehydrogenase